MRPSLIQELHVAPEGERPDAHASGVSQSAK